MIEDSHAGLGFLRGSLLQKGEVRSELGSHAWESQWPWLLVSGQSLLPGEGSKERPGAWSSLQSRTPRGSGLSGHKQPQLSARSAASSGVCGPGKGGM